MSRTPIYLITAMCALNHSGFGGGRVAISLYALELGVTQFTVGILMALYVLSPPGRAAESSGLRVMVNNVMHLVVPVLFGSLGTAFGYMPVFLSNTVLLTGAGELIRRKILIENRLQENKNGKRETGNAVRADRHDRLCWTKDGRCLGHSSRKRRFSISRLADA